MGEICSIVLEHVKVPCGLILIAVYHCYVMYCTNDVSSCYTDTCYTAAY